MAFVSLNSGRSAPWLHDPLLDSDASGPRDLRARKVRILLLDIGEELK